MVVIKKIQTDNILFVFKIGIVIFLSIFFVSCSSTRNIDITSQPSGAMIELYKTNGKQIKTFNCKTPCKIKISDNYKTKYIKLNKDGFISQKVDISIDKIKIAKAVTYNLPVVIALSFIIPEPLPILGARLIPVHGLEYVNIKLERTDKKNENNNKTNTNDANIIKPTSK